MVGGKIFLMIWGFAFRELNKTSCVCPLSKMFKDKLDARFLSLPLPFPKHHLCKGGTLLVVHRAFPRGLSLFMVSSKVVMRITLTFLENLSWWVTFPACCTVIIRWAWYLG